jgi:copper homeostasis protein (lipoprotein)
VLWLLALAVGLVIGCTSAVPRPDGAGRSGAELRLPASFRGDLPCADCRGIRYHLDLWSDQVFHLRREWLGKDLVRADVGRWRLDAAGRVLVLRTGSETPLPFEIVSADKLRLLDIKGRPIESTLPYDLVSDGTLAPADLTLRLGGEMTYLADAARVTECLTGRDYPVAQEGDFVTMQRAYLRDVERPGARLYVTLDGSITDRPHMEGRGAERTVLVRRFIGAWPSQRCERARADASLVNTYWRVHSILGRPVTTTTGRREPHLLLRQVDGRRTYAATIGCNQLVGGYTVTGEGLAFAAGASTRMACPPPLDALEQSLGEVLVKTTRWQITGSTLELLDEGGAPTALFEAVHF